MTAVAEDPLAAFWSLPGEHVELPISEIAAYPLLAECLSAWQRVAAEGLPATIDPLLFPRQAIRGLNLIEHDPATDDWKVRVVGGLVTDHVGQELRGTGLTQNFTPADRERVRAAIRAAMQRGQPDLMRRLYRDPRGVRWAYVRLFLPLSSDGTALDRFATVIDPATFGRVTPDPTTAS